MKRLSSQRWFNMEVCWGLSILALIVILAILVPILTPYSTDRSAGDPLVPPCARNPFGTDQLGRDVFTRTFAAARLDLFLASVGVAIPLLIGTLAGAVAGTTQNRLASYFWTMVVDAINVFPFLVLVIAVVSFMGSGVPSILTALALRNWARYAKLARAKALTLRDADFVQAARVLGYSRTRVLVKHVVPNIYGEALAYGLSDFVLVIVAVAGLSFLGIGIHPPTPEWGAMMSEGRLFLTMEWWICVFPGLVLSLTAIGVALLAEGLTGSRQSAG